MRSFPPDAEGDAGGGDQDGDSDSEVNIKHCQYEWIVIYCPLLSFSRGGWGKGGLASCEYHTYMKI